MPLVVHYVQAPEWRWYILGYFVLAGLAGGCYTLGTLLRLFGRPADEPAARLCFLLALPLLVVCPILLTLDLGHPLRFWHMVVDTGAGGPGLNFKYWDPMSLGVWALLVAGIFATLTFLEVVAVDERHPYPGSHTVARLLGGHAGRVVNVLGSLFALFIAGYTGVLLSVSNQPVWSDTWALGGLFLASGMSGAAALVILASRWRRGAAASHAAVADADASFALLEGALLIVLFVTLALAGQLLRAVATPWIVLWAVAVVSLVPPLGARFARGPSPAARGGEAAVARTGLRADAVAIALLVLVGVVCLRAAVLWSAQA
jgi:formate-dependent nitrite reductase membrane component NrfD